MDIDVFRAEELKTVFRVLRTALNPSGPLEPAEKKFLETYAKITGWPLRTEPLSIFPEEVRVEGQHQRKRLVQLAAIAALLGNPVRQGSAEFVEELARSLAVQDPVTEVLQALAEGKRFKARLLTARRGGRVMLKEAYLAEGVMGIVRFFGAAAFGARVNKDKLWSYKKLGLLPEGTLGREYWKHLTELGFGFPGERWGIPAAVSYHDVSHVLNGYRTDPDGEIQQGSFQGGNRREDGFFFIQFVILQFHQGIRLTPVAKPEVGYFDPAKVLWAIHRGANVNVDVTHQWNYWPLMPLPLEEARRQIGLLPRLEELRDAA